MLHDITGVPRDCLASRMDIGTPFAGSPGEEDAARALAYLSSLLSRCGHGAKVLQNAQPIELGPLFHDLASSDAADVDPGVHDLLARRRNAHELPVMRAAHREAVHDLVAFGTLVLNGEIEVGEGDEVEQVRLFAPGLSTQRRTSAGEVRCVVVSNELVNDARIFPVIDFRIIAADDGFVGCGGHDVSPCLVGIPTYGCSCATGRISHR